MLMSKAEINEHIQVWPANARAPLDRETQILFMKSARRRHLALIKRLDKGDHDVVD